MDKAIYINLLGKNPPIFASDEGMSETGIIPPPSIIPRMEIADIINEEFFPITINIHTESVLKNRDVTIM